MTDIPISIAMGDYDRTRPLHDGRVKIDGVTHTSMLLSPEEMFFRAFRHRSFDVSELSFSSYCVKLSRGEQPYVGIPVFLSRAFRHSSILIRTDKGIAGPEDLKGRRIGIAEWQLTANVWVRGIMEHHGVAQSDVTWVRGGMHTPGRPEKIPVVIPDDVTIESAPDETTLNDMLRAGDIDGYIGPRTLRCFDEGHPHVGRLFKDGIAAAADHFRQTGIFPIMHVLGLRRELAEAHPWLPGALLKAFSQSKAIALDALVDTSATKVTMPFVEDVLGVARGLIGPDFWRYGVPGNEAVLDVFLDLHHRQGLSAHRLGVEDLFHPSTYEAYSL